MAHLGSRRTEDVCCSSTCVLRTWSTVFSTMSSTLACNSIVDRVLFKLATSPWFAALVRFQHKHRKHDTKTFHSDIQPQAANMQ